MPTDAIRASAAALANALDDTTTQLSAEEREELRALQAKLEAALATQTAPPVDEVSGVVERTVASLESASPELTKALGRLVETLSELGI